MTVCRPRAVGAHRRARRADERGAVAVEFAIVLPLLVMLLLGVTTTGLTYADHLAISNGAREGARFGAAVDYCQGAATCAAGAPTTWADSVQSRVLQAYANSGTTLTTGQVCVLLQDSTGATLATPTAQGTTCSSSAPGSPAAMLSGTCVVKVWVVKPASINLGVASLPAFNIGSKSVSYYGRAVSGCASS